MPADKNNNGIVLKIILTVIGLAVTVSLAAFTSLESRKLDKSAFEIKTKADDCRLDRIEKSIDRMDGKIDTLLQKE